MARVTILPPEEHATAEGIKAGGWWHASEDGHRVNCDLCPRACSLKENDRGFCFVRQNLGGRMVSTTYGRSTGFCIDPIEKKPLNQFYPGTAVLSFGTAGCNLGCKFCQNWEISKSREIDSLAQVADPETIARAAKELRCHSVAFTYNDPVIWAEYAIDTARACHELGVKTVAVTAGYITPIARPAFYEVMDAANVDLKGFTEEFYWKLTSGHLDPVRDTLRWLVHESNVWVEITNLVIPAANDTSDEFQRMCDWVLKELGPSVPLHFTAFHPDFRLRDREGTPRDTLRRAYEIARRMGLNYVYTGNLSDRQHESTYCPECGAMVIERDRYQIGQYRLRGNRCTECGKTIAGHFADRPGDWGPRRQPVRIGSFAGKAIDVAASTFTANRARSVKETSPAQEGNPVKEVTPLQPPPPSNTGMSVRPDLTADQQQRVFHAACLQVAAVVRCEACAPLVPILGDAAAVPVYGAFVTLKRGGRLRSCCGFMGQSIALAQAVECAAIRAAKDDPRFPRISPSELEHLEVDVWLLWGPQPMSAKGEDRASAVAIGRHGLQIARGDSRGLLLPGVAVEHHLDARQFLEQVCLKAGLERNDWKRDDTLLMTFEGFSIEGPMPRAVLADEGESAATGPSPADVATLAEFCRGNLAALASGATPSFYLSNAFDGSICGVLLSVGPPGNPTNVEGRVFAQREDKPLQATLYSLTEALARAIRNRSIDATALTRNEVHLTVLRDPAMHGTADAPDLAGFDSGRRALVVGDSAQTVWIYDPSRTAEQLLAEALDLGHFPKPAAAAVFSMAAVSTAPRAAASFALPPQASPGVRPAAVAGTFYPGTPQEIDRLLGQFLTELPKPEPWPAALVPHAGWIYSGRLAATTLARVEIPEQVIVFCPRHRAGGADWAVTPHETWSLPGGNLAADPELARRLASSIPGLVLDALAHQQEHAIEVQLPILARLAPKSRVIGIAIGRGDLAQLQRFAEGLANVIASLPHRPLLVISSDMNHYASDADTRRLDQVALRAMQTLDPVRLFETVTQQRISMCGLRPAVIVMETLRRLDTLHRMELVGYTTSAEASGDSRRCVGYAGVLLG
jgi:AmmeMemoRadiSam system radical SAM enzyme/AmmeMemoRadiSam system protein B/AmmeMemoRadiSam system protein A